MCLIANRSKGLRAFRDAEERRRYLYVQAYTSGVALLITGPFHILFSFTIFYLLTTW